jgi:hypothetical protein
MMAKAAPSPILQLILQTVEDQTVGRLSDQRLLQQFCDRQDEPALGALLRRHGPGRDEARAALAAVYGTYTEGFTTPDLVDAAAFLKDEG